MADVTMKLNPETRRVYIIGGTHDIALDNPDFSIYIECKLKSGELRDILTVRNKRNDTILAEVDLGGPKKPPIIG